MVHAHDQAGVQEVQVGISLRVSEECQQSHEVGAHDGGQRCEIGRRGGVGHQRVGDLQQLCELLEVADAVAHVDAVGVALAVSRYCQLTCVASVGSAHKARCEGRVGTGHAVRVAQFDFVVDCVVEGTALDALSVRQVVLRDASQALSTPAASAQRRAGLACRLHIWVWLVCSVVVWALVVASACQETCSRLTEHTVGGRERVAGKAVADAFEAL